VTRSLDAALARLGVVERRAPYAYATSWPLEEVSLRRADGSRLRLIVKRFDRGGSAGKPAFVCDPGREIAAYALLAGAQRAFAPRCYASGRDWLALEKLAGAELWQHGDAQAWHAAARWAARLHRAYAGLEPAPRLLHHDPRLHRRWLARARAAHGRALERLRAPARAAIERLAALPRTLIHGELYPSNVIVRGRRAVAVDWEMAAVGPAVIDLAALATGWGPRERAAILAAAGGAHAADLAAARLVLALQWLGWEPDWEPPPQQRRDWLAEAHEAAEELRCGG